MQFTGAGCSADGLWMQEYRHFDGEDVKGNEMQKYCPICDQPIKGRFCKTCGEFVKPYQHEVNYRFNESHDPKSDPDCAYHGTDQGETGQQRAYGTVQGWITQEPKKSTSTMSDRERMARAKASFESHGATNEPRNRSSETKAPTAVKILVIVMVLLFASSFIISIVSTLWPGFQDDYDFDIVRDADEDDMDFPFDNYVDEGWMSDEDYEALCEELGFDEDGYRDLDDDEVAAAGEPCNGWEHFDTTSRTAARHIRSALEEAGIASTDPQAGKTYNYEYLDHYGEITSYYEPYTYVTLEDESYEDGYSGYMAFISDSVTDELMVVYVIDMDQDTFITACKMALMELEEDQEFCDKMEEDLRTTFDNDSEYNANDLVYGDLCLDVEYKADSEIPFTGWIYLNDAT
jgi:hypothetical protein